MCIAQPTACIVVVSWFLLPFEALVQRHVHREDIYEDEIMLSRESVDDRSWV